MAIGTVSEWVAGISQFLAVCVALFLPYYNQHKKLKRRTRNLRVIIALGPVKLTNEII
jgi:putative effector of murein hydrolase